MKTLALSTVYLILLSVAFSLVALMFSVLESYGRIEYNLGIGLITSSIFMVLTIVFLNILFVFREQSEWKKVKDEVYSMIQDELGLMFHEILDFVEDGSTIQSYLMTKKEARNEACLSTLKELKDSKELRLNDSNLKLLLQNKISLETFPTASQTLKEVQIMYSRLLSSQITRSLMQIQNLIRVTRNTIAILSQPRASIKKSTPLNPALPLVYQEFAKAYQEKVEAASQELEKEIPKLLAPLFKKILEEIYNLHKMGIEFCPYLMPEQ